MADLSDGVNWSELDANNNKASPNGWPEGMMPSGVNDSARNDKGALKRFWDRVNPVQAITVSAGVWTFTTGNPTYPTAYVDGEVFAFRPATDGAAGDQFQVNGLGGKPIWKRTFGAWAPVAAGDIQTRLPARLVYDSTLNGGAGAFVLTDPFVAIQSTAGGGISTTGNITTGGSITATGPITSSGGITGAGMVASTGPNAALGFTDRTTSAQWLWYATGNSARLWMSGDRFTVDTGGNASAPGAFTAGGVITAPDAHLSVATIGGSTFSSNNVNVPGTVTGSVISAGGCTWQNSSAWMYTPNSLQTNGNLQVNASMTANGNVTAGGSVFVGGCQIYNGHGGYVTTPNGLWVDGPTQLGGVNCGPINGGTATFGDVHVNGWLYGNGNRLNIATHAAPAADGGYYCGLSDAAWAAVDSYAYITKSSATLKRAVRTINATRCLDAVQRLRPVTFRYKHELIPGLQAGFLSEEVRDALAAAGLKCDAMVREDGLAYQQLIPILCAGLQQLAARLTSLEARCST